MDCGGGDHYNGRLAIRRAEKLQAEVCGDRGIGLRPRLYAGSVCDDSATEAVHAAPYKRTWALPFCRPNYTHHFITVSAPTWKKLPYSKLRQIVSITNRRGILTAGATLAGRRATSPASHTIAVCPPVRLVARPSVFACSASSLLCGRPRSRVQDRWSKTFDQCRRNESRRRISIAASSLLSLFPSASPELTLRNVH